MVLIWWLRCSIVAVFLFGWFNCVGCLWAGLCGFCIFVRGVFTVLCVCFVGCCLLWTYLDLVVCGVCVDMLRVAGKL